MLLFGDLTVRKSPAETVYAFQKAFPREDNVRLVLKTQHGNLGYASGLIPRIPDPRISVINKTISRGELLKLLYDADCLIWISKGEGFGLPPLQAALTGLPVIMTTHTGMEMFYNERYFYGVQSVRLDDAPTYGQWYLPDIDHAAAQLRYVYEHRASAAKKAKAAEKYVRSAFSLDAFAGNLRTYLETLE